MEITNKTRSKLVLPDGTAIGAGQSVEVDAFNPNHHVMSMWIKEGMLTSETGFENANQVDDVNLEDLTVPQLKDLAEQKGVEFDSGIKKSELIELLKGE